MLPTFLLVLLLALSQMVSSKDGACDMERVKKCAEKFIFFVNENLNDTLTKDKMLLKCR